MNSVIKQKIDTLGQYLNEASETSDIKEFQRLFDLVLGTMSEVVEMLRLSGVYRTDSGDMYHLKRYLTASNSKEWNPSKIKAHLAP